jgi:hypothetical protein
MIEPNGPTSNVEDDFKQTQQQLQEALMVVQNAEEYDQILAAYQQHMQQAMERNIANAP